MIVHFWFTEPTNKPNMNGESSGGAVIILDWVWYLHKVSFFSSRDHHKFHIRNVPFIWNIGGPREGTFKLEICQESVLKISTASSPAKMRWIHAAKKILNSEDTEQSSILIWRYFSGNNESKKVVLMLQTLLCT